MRYRTSLALGIALLSAGASAQPPRPTNLDGFNDRIMKLSPENQRAAMRQAVTNNGLRCGRVDAARFQQPFGNLMMWVARCTPGGDYGVFVGRDESVQVRPCKDLVSLKLPACRPLPPPAPPRRRG